MEGEGAAGSFTGVTATIAWICWDTMNSVETGSVAS